MSDQFHQKLERSSFGTSAAKAARRSVPAEKAHSLVARSTAKKISKNRARREGK